MRVRALAAVTALLVVVVTLRAQGPAPAFPDARASDPVTLGWMKGTPPPVDKRPHRPAAPRHDDGAVLCGGLRR